MRGGYGSRDAWGLDCRIRQNQASLSRGWPNLNPNPNPNSDPDPDPNLNLNPNPNPNPNLNPN